jgi:alpha-1,6-mannosyltransferase
VSGQPKGRRNTGGTDIVHIADMTMFYAPASGGVRTYLDAKHRRLAHYPDVRHSLLIPGASLSNADGIYIVPAPAVPFGKGYRFPLRVAPWRKVIKDLQPDLIEVGDPYLTAWAAVDARRQLDVPVIGFYQSAPGWALTSKATSPNCTRTLIASWHPAR